MLQCTRKECKENRSVKILFSEKGSVELKESVEPKKKKTTFVSPYGAKITEDSYYEQKRSMEKEKKEKQKKVEMKTKSCKRKIVFMPPFSQNENSSCLTVKK